MGQGKGCTGWSWRNSDSRLVSPNRTLHLSAPSPLVGDTLTVPRIEECPHSEPPSPTRKEHDIPAPADPLHSPSASLVAAGGSLPDSESEGSPAEHPDGGSPPSGQEEQPCPAGPLDCAGQDFSFLEVSREGAASSPPCAPGAAGCRRLLWGRGCHAGPPRRGSLWIRGPQCCCGVCVRTGWGCSGAPSAGCDPSWGCRCCL